MKTLGRLLVALLLLGNLLMLTALSVHVVRSPEKCAVVAKSQLTLMETFVDTRAWTAADLKDHSAVVSRLVQAGKGDLLSHITGDSRSAAKDWSVSPRLLDAPPAHPAAQKPAASNEARQTSIFDFPNQK